MEVQEITGSHKSAMGLINKMLSRLFPLIRGKKNSSSKRAQVQIHSQWKKPKQPISESRVKASTRSPSLHLSREPLVSGLHCTAAAVAFPFSLINPTLCTGLVSRVNQLPHEPVLWPVKARALDTGPQHFTLACNKT
jgi:hypothetical protein